MELILLRARAVCESCQSKLPPRTEAWWDAPTGRALCVTCERYQPPAAPTEVVACDPQPEPPAAPTEADRPDPQPQPAPPDLPVALPPAAARPAPAAPPAPARSLAPAAAPVRAPAPGPAPARAPAPGPASARPPAAAAQAAASPAPPTGPDVVPAARRPDTESVSDFLSGVGAPRREGHLRPVTPIFRRSRPGDGTDVDAPSEGRRERSVDPVGGRTPPPDTELQSVEPSYRGDMGEGRVGQTLEGARVHGLEVLHGPRIASLPAPIDHLVIAVNGVWVVHAVPVLEGRLERRDLGDWFSADPRLHIADVDRSSVVAGIRTQVQAVTALLARGPFADIPIRGALCFGSVRPGWVSEPFSIDGVSITWRRKLVEPLLDPVMVDGPSRSALLRSLLSSVAVPHSPRQGADRSHPVAG